MFWTIVIQLQSSRQAKFCSKRELFHRRVTSHAAAWISRGGITPTVRRGEPPVLY